MIMKRLYFCGIFCAIACVLFADELNWQTHFSYNNVEQVAMYGDEVYALANGKIFSINE